MAERRMFSKTIVTSDAFLDMSPDSQCLYYQLCLNADDDGFVNNTKSTIRTAGLKIENLTELLKNKFVLEVKGIIVIKHWFINNSIQKDRRKETKYPEIKDSLFFEKNNSYTTDKYEEYKEDTETYTEDNDTDITQYTECKQAEKEVYTEDKSDGYKLDTSWIQDSNKLDPQYRIDKDRIDKSSINNTHNINETDKSTKKDKETESEDLRVDNARDLELETTSQPRKDYAQAVFDILFANKLPCNNNYISFLMRDFKLGMSEIAGLHLNSEEVIQAVKNYAQVIQLKRAGQSWWESEQNFFNFCKNKTILKFIPGNFNISQFIKTKPEKTESGGLPTDRIRL